MSRSGYSEDCQNWDHIRWRGAVQSAIRGALGQKFLRELVAALDALPEKKLIAHELKDENGAVCALGSVAVARGLDVSGVDFEDRDKVAAVFGIARALAAEIMFENDDDFGWRSATPERRFEQMRAWAVAQLAAA